MGRPWKQPRIIRHERVYVPQFERLGRRSFLKRYIQGGLTGGYEDSALEREARLLSAEFHGTDNGAAGSVQAPAIIRSQR